MAPPLVDVKARGVIVGEVREITNVAGGAEIRLALQPDDVELLPSDARAQLLPKTLFGEKFVALVVDDDSAAPPLASDDVIPQDRSATARETSEALDALLPLLQTLQPEQVSTTLNALSTTLRGRGEQVGNNLELARDYLTQINPELPTLAEDFRGTADFAEHPHRLRRRPAGRAGQPVGEVIGDTFGRLQPGLHITLEFTETNGGYVPGDEPEYLAEPSPTCRGLIGPPEIPFPEYVEADDGFRDGQGVNERTGERDGEPPTGPEGPHTYSDQRRQAGNGGGTSTQGSATPFSPASYDRAAVGAVVAPALGVSPGEVPDVAVLLFGPVARDTVVTPA